MKRLWGRKVFDLAYAEFVNILEWEATKFGTSVVKIDRWAPSSKAFHICGWKNDTLIPTDRDWVCPSCGTYLDRDVNAAINIRSLGITKLTNKKPA
jgi:putative transposase